MRLRRPLARGMLARPRTKDGKVTSAGTHRAELDSYSEQLYDSPDDWAVVDAVERFRIQPVKREYPYPGLLLSVRWPTGATSYYADTMPHAPYWAKDRTPCAHIGHHIFLVDEA